MSSSTTVFRQTRNAGLNGQAGSKASSSSGQDTVYKRVYEWSQILARRCLQGWGRFVATRPITVLLLCCVFLCGLAYPVLSLYAWASPASAPDFLTFLRNSPTLNLVGDDGSIARARDLKLPWQDLDAVVINGEEACWQRIPKFREVTVQQILLGFPAGNHVASEHGVLDRKPMHGLHRLQQRLQSALANPQNRSIPVCVTQAPTDSISNNPPSCVLLSPLSFWENNENDLLSDPSLLATVNIPKRTDMQFPLRQENLFVGRSYAGRTLRKADYAVLTLYLEGGPRPLEMTKLVRHITEDLGYFLVEPARIGSKLVMKHRSEVRVRSVAWEDAIFYTGYIVVGFYIYLTLRRLDKVHSRSGLVLTGVVQMIASGLMSLSLCALSGYRFNLVPGKLIPFLIVVLGVDNMFVLTTAVSNTSINLPVKERVAEGLSQCGVSIFVNLLIELAVSGLVYLFINVRVIREMAVFAAVALIVDYIMEMTYFITVLSIDMHRLELADFLNQGTRKTGNPLAQNSHNRNLPKAFEVFFSFVQNRQARTWTAIILIGSNYLLYLLFGSDYFVPAFCSNITHSKGPAFVPSTPLTPSEALWQILGAIPSEAIHIHTPLPIVLFFDSFDIQTNFMTLARASFSTAFKTVVLPISATTLGLYLLLAHLLKGTDQLPNGTVSTPDTELVPDEASPAPNLSATFLEVAKADIEVMQVSSNGASIVYWIPAEGCLRVTNTFSQATSRRLALANVLKSRENIQVLVTDNDLSMVAAVTSQPRLLLWSIKTSDQEPECMVRNLQELPKVSNLYLSFSELATASPPRPPRATPSDRRTPAWLLTSHVDGSLRYWSTVDLEGQSCIGSFGDSGKVTTSHQKAERSSRELVARLESNGVDMDFWSRSMPAMTWTRLPPIPAGDASLGHATCKALFTEEDCSLFLVGYSSGEVVVWHIESERRAFHARLHSGAVRQLRLQRIPRLRCPSCHIHVNDALIMLSSDLAALFLTRLHAPHAEVCDCDLVSSTAMNGEGSNSLMQLSSPPRKLPSPRGTAEEQNRNLAYPLSPHAMRRLSHATERRKPEDQASKGHEGDAITAKDSASASRGVNREALQARTSRSTSNSSNKANWAALHIGSMALTIRDVWDVCESQVVGFRKTHIACDSVRFAALSRWQAWSCSLQELKVLSNGSLDIQQAALENSLGGEISEPPEEAVLLPFTRIRHLQASQDGTAIAATFGNAAVVFKAVRGSSR